MHTARVGLILGLLAVLAIPLIAAAAPANQYTLEFIPTQNVPAGAKGTMTIKQIPGGSIVNFQLRGAYPSTIYTIWTVFNLLDEEEWAEAIADNKFEVPSISANTLSDFPVEGNGVTPTAPMSSGFTHGMGADPGATFVTDKKGHGQVEVKLDYDLIDAAPVSNRDIVFQCAPFGATAFTGSNGKFTITCPSGSSLVRISTLYLREFIGQYAVAERAAMCANYRPEADPDVVGAGNTPQATNARRWQCVDPATADKYGNGLARVPRFALNHFRLANHPDALTHGHIGGNGFDHFIDMVGRRCDLKPLPAGTSPCALPPPIPPAP
jgi:hypothetical protein